MKYGRNFRGVLVTLEYGTDLGPYSNVPVDGARITLPDGSQIAFKPTSCHQSIDEAACYHASHWRVDEWKEAGSQGAI